MHRITDHWLVPQPLELLGPLSKAKILSTHALRKIPSKTRNRADWNCVNWGPPVVLLATFGKKFNLFAHSGSLDARTTDLCRNRLNCWGLTVVPDVKNPPKIREIEVHTHYCSDLTNFKFWICSAGNDWKWNLFEFEETCMEKLVKPFWFSAGFRLLELLWASQQSRNFWARTPLGNPLMTLDDAFFSQQKIEEKIKS